MKIVPLISLLGIILSVNSCIGIGGCKNTAEKEVFSPDGKLRVVLYNRGCGATVGFITGISILASNENLSDDDKANVVLAENAIREYWKDNGKDLIKGKMNFDAKWISNNEVLIYYTESEFLTKREKFDDIAIKYELISR